MRPTRLAWHLVSAVLLTVLFVVTPAAPSSAQTAPGVCPPSGYPYYGNASYYPYGGYGYGGYGYGSPYYGNLSYYGGGYGSPYGGAYGYGSPYGAGYGYGYGYPSYGGAYGYGGYGYGGGYGYPYYGGAYGVGGLYGGYGYGGTYGYPYYGAYPSFYGYPTTIPYYGGALGAANPPSATAAPSQTVSIASTGFTPNSATLPVGQTLRWTNNDTTIHAVQSDVGLWASGCLASGASYAFTFTVRGTYTYVDPVNGQRGTITVN
jgi:plastocyanin